MIRDWNEREPEDEIKSRGNSFLCFAPFLEEAGKRAWGLHGVLATPLSYLKLLLLLSINISGAGI